MMNKRIRELADEAARFSAVMALPTGESGDNLFVERFAELIVRECLEQIEFQYGGGNLMEDGKTHNPEWDNAIECVSSMIKQHFGL